MARRLALRLALNSFASGAREAKRARHAQEHWSRRAGLNRGPADYELSAADSQSMAVDATGPHPESNTRDDVVKSTRFVTVILMGVVFFAGPAPLAAQGIG